MIAPQDFYSILPRFDNKPPDYQIGGNKVAYNTDQTSDRIYIIWNEPNHSFRNWLMNYATYPAVVGSEPSLYSAETNTIVDITNGNDDGFLNVLVENGYTHVYLHNYDEYFITGYQNYFVEKQDIARLCLYIITDDVDGSYLLKKIV
jgi:hypothetical protein